MVFGYKKTIILEIVRVFFNVFVKRYGKILFIGLWKFVSS